jgi:hypothetical protein
MTFAANDPLVVHIEGGNILPYNILECEIFKRRLIGRLIPVGPNTVWASR